MDVVLITKLNIENTHDWVYKMANLVKKDSNEISIGYDHYFLINKIKDKQDPFQQKDWINLNCNQNLYLYLPEANGIDEAAQQVKIEDSAKTWPIGIETPVTWTKVNKTTYTNNTFITQDTSVGGFSLMDKFKFDQIKNSNKWNTWTEKEQKSFSLWGSLLSSSKDKSWWNANGWEKLLTTEKNLTSKKGEKVSQLNLYKKWINQKVIGMNVPLSLIDKYSFTLQTTKINHVFLFSTTPKQVWIDNTGNISIINTPHWGFTMNIINQNQKILFKTPQLFNPKNAFKENSIISYLNEKEFFSFNIQETDKFKDYRIN